MHDKTLVTILQRGILYTLLQLHVYDLISLFNHIAPLVPSSVVTLARPPSYSPLKDNNRSFRYASPFSIELTP